MDKINLNELKDRLKCMNADCSADSSARSDAYARIVSLFDEGSFFELGALNRKRSDSLLSNESDTLESVICGFGSVDGRLVYAFSQDMTRISGAVTEGHAKKICDLYRLATDNGAPVVGIFDSAGALIPDGVSALAAYGRILKSVSDASGTVPQIALVCGSSNGLSSVVCGLFDFVITTAAASVTVSSAFQLDRMNNASAESENGISAVCLENDAEAVNKVKEILKYLPSNNSDGLVFDISSDSMAREVSLGAYRSSSKITDLISAVADDGRFTELYGKYAEEMFTGFVSFGGISCGVVANNRAVNNGTITAKAARKASKFVSDCDSFGIPVVTFIDSDGADNSDDSEMYPYSAELAKLAHAYCSSVSPKITVIAGEAYGSAFTLMGSKSTGSDIVMSLKDSKVSALRPETAVAFLLNDDIAPGTSREDLEKLWGDTVASAANAAASGEIDCICDDGELRARICSALNMLSTKAVSPSSRKHLVMPL